ncbi:hypothetical protein B0H13DRAFT_2663181 [Mycena leptocephala]|nr:hypothetical protein B0H13DRAFT_2663181 [Mycena leptocephala]
MSSKRRVLTPTQSHTIQDDSDADVPLKIQTSRSLRWKLPVSNSANLFHVGEDTTLCYAPRSSECDLTACASASSGLKMKNSPAPSSLELFLPDLPEIPDWYEDEQPKQASRSPEPVPAIPAHVLNTPTLDTPQSDYHSLEDYHPTSLCCQDILAELAAAQCSDGAAACESPGLVLSSCKHKPEPPQTVQAPSHGRPLFTHHIRRSYSLDLADQRARAAEFPYMVPLDVGLGYGLGSPFSLAPISFPISPDVDLHTLPDELAQYQYASPSLSLAPQSNPNPKMYLSPSSSGLRRYEALSVWRPQAPSPPSPPVRLRSPSNSDDIRSLEQPFPSSASLWVLDAPPPATAGLRVPQSATWPPTRLAETRPRGHDQGMWTLEEQITIAVLQAMDSRDMRAAGQGSHVHSRLVTGRSRKSKVGRLLGRIWRRGVVW